MAPGERGSYLRTAMADVNKFTYEEKYFPHSETTVPPTAVFLFKRLLGYQAHGRQKPKRTLCDGRGSRPRDHR